MAEITTKVLGVTVESFFKQAVLFKEARHDEVAKKCLEAFGGYNLTSKQINVRSGDLAFNYDLSFALFNGNGTFRISAEKTEVAFQNAASSKDLEVILDCIAKIYEQLPLQEVNRTLISANAHAVFQSAEELTRFSQKYTAPDRQIVSGGVIAYVQLPAWNEEIRVSIDKSLAFPATGLFLTWSTVYRSAKPTRKVLLSAKDVLRDAITKLGLSFPQGNSL